MRELWKDIPNFSRYQISNYGRVWNVVFKMPMKTSKTQAGNIKISLIDDENNRRSMSVALLVAELFVERPNDRCVDIILIDGDLSNVAAYNLAWRSRRGAYLYTRQMRTEQPIYFYNLKIRNNTTGREYKNIIEAGVTEGLLFQDIWESTYNGKRVFPYGHTYEIISRV